MAPDVFKGFIILFFIFVPLERLFALHPQKIFRQGWGTDAIYFAIGHFVGRAAGWAISAVLVARLFGGLANSELQRSVAFLPVWLQLIATIFIGEIGYYTAHKLTHTIPWLWKFHAVHHSVQRLDWLAAVRVHPIDQIFTRVFQILPIYILGFNERTLSLYYLFSAFEAFFIHANVKFKLGILRFIFVTPEFHHWHHSANPEAFNKNFSAQLPVVDVLFGTFYLPGGKMPDKYGIAEPVPSGYIGQILYPFRFRQTKN